MTSAVVAAIDLGASSGRVIVGDVGRNRLHVAAVARFGNDAQAMAVWDLLDAIRPIGTA